MSVPRIPRVLLLDALGTLVELEPPVQPLRRELQERFGVLPSAEEASAALRAEIGFYRAHHDEARDAASLADLRARAAAALRDALPAWASTLELGPLTEALLAALRFRPFPEVPAVLRAARASGVRLVVVSNWDVSLHDVLVETGLAPLLDATVTSAEVGTAKPAPAIFMHALGFAGVAAHEAIHVGDSVEHDVVGARAAGIEPLLVVRAEKDERAPVAGVRTIRSLQPLLELLPPPGRREKRVGGRPRTLER
jgi:putative hydrolase of the HAD superfamily